MKLDEIVSSSGKYSVEELNRINKLAVGEVAVITLDDMELFSRWKVDCAIREARFEAEMQALDEQTKAAIENAKVLNDKAVEAFEAQAQLAYAKLKAVENGEV